MSEPDRIHGPDERALLAHLAGAKFQSALDVGDWRVVEVSWPHALIAVSAAERPGAPTEFLLRFDLSGYPQEAPTAGLWDQATNALLAADKRPKGERAGSVFRGDWENGRALYAPFDRVGLREHPEWAQKHPRFTWNPRRDLSFYLRNVHELLNDDDYLGI